VCTAIMKINYQRPHFFSKGSSKENDHPEAHESVNQMVDVGLEHDDGASPSSENIDSGNIATSDDDNPTIEKKQKRMNGLFSKIRLHKKRSEEIRSTAEEPSQMEEERNQEQETETCTGVPVDASNEKVEFCGYEIGDIADNEDVPTNPDVATTGVSAEDSTATTPTGTSRFCGGLFW